MAILYSAIRGSTQIYKVDTDAATVERAFTAGIGAMGLAFGLSQDLFVFSGSAVQSYNIDTGSRLTSFYTPGIPQTWGLAVDHNGDVWPGGYGEQHKYSASGVKQFEFSLSGDTDPRAWTLGDNFCIGVGYYIYQYLPTSPYTRSLLMQLPISIHDGGFDFDSRDETVWAVKNYGKSYYQISIATGAILKVVTPTPIGGLSSNPNVSYLAHRDRFSVAGQRLNTCHM